MRDETTSDLRAVTIVSAAITTAALAFFLHRHQTYVHIDAIAHVNKARGLWDNETPGLKQLGSIWLPLQHILIAPLTWFDILWSTGLAGSLLSAACFVGTSRYLFATGKAWTGSPIAGWLAFTLFAFNPHLIYLFTTPMTEPLMIVCSAGLAYYLVRWIQSQSWKPFAFACLMAFAGTLTRYEGWAIAATAIPLVFILARRQRVAATVLFTGAAALGPMLWMIFNMVYFDDPLMFAYGRGSAQDYAHEYFYRTGKLFPTAGKLIDSLTTYFIDVAYCLNPTVLWLAVLGIVLAFVFWRYTEWRVTLLLTAMTLVPFAFYVYNLYANQIPVMMPGLLPNEPGSIYNVRYGTAMTATAPLFAAFVLYTLYRQAERRRFYCFLLLPLLAFPDPTPAESQETPSGQFTENLFYTEGIHNQSFWMPPFVEVAQRLKADIASTHDGEGRILANTRIVHPVAWATAIPLRRFINEMNKDRWDRNLNSIDPGIRWVITEEGDQLWNAQGKTLERDFVQIASAKTPSTGVVHLYRRR